MIPSFFIRTSLALYIVNVIMYALFPEYAGIAFRLFASMAVGIMLFYVMRFLRRSSRLQHLTASLLTDVGYDALYLPHVALNTLRLVVPYCLIMFGVYEFVRPRLQMPIDFLYAYRHLFNQALAHNFLTYLLFSLVLFGVAGLKNKMIMPQWPYLLIALEVLVGVVLCIMAMVLLFIFLRLSSIIF
jgi:hypothetical protein